MAVTQYPTPLAPSSACKADEAAARALALDRLEDARASVPAASEAEIASKLIQPQAPSDDAVSSVSSVDADVEKLEEFAKKAAEAAEKAREAAELAARAVAQWRMDGNIRKVRLTFI